MELIRLGERTYYIKNPTNVGVYKTGEDRVILIDSGNDKDAGKKILKIMDDQGWKVEGIINTHSHTDHTGGNHVIAERTGCKIYSQGMEKAVIENTLLEPTYLYGSYPFKELRNKFIMGKNSSADNVDGNLPEGLTTIMLKGHSFDMIGVKTSDGVCFLADALMSRETIEKYGVFYLYNVGEHLETLNALRNLEGSIFVPSHGEPVDNIQDLIGLNGEKIEEIRGKIFELCLQPKIFEDILKELFDVYGIKMNTNQYVLIGSTLKSYLSYMKEMGQATYDFVENRMVWRALP